MNPDVSSDGQKKWRLREQLVLGDRVIVLHSMKKHYHHPCRICTAIEKKKNECIPDCTRSVVSAIQTGVKCALHYHSPGSQWGQTITDHLRFKCSKAVFKWEMLSNFRTLSQVKAPYCLQQRYEPFQCDFVTARSHANDYFLPMSSP